MQANPGADRTTRPRPTFGDDLCLLPNKLVQFALVVSIDRPGAEPSTGNIHVFGLCKPLLSDINVKISLSLLLTLLIYVLITLKPLQARFCPTLLKKLNYHIMRSAVVEQLLLLLSNNSTDAQNRKASSRTYKVSFSWIWAMSCPPLFLSSGSNDRHPHDCLKIIVCFQKSIM